MTKNDVEVNSSRLLTFANQLSGAFNAFAGLSAAVLSGYALSHLASGSFSHAALELAGALGLRTLASTLSEESVTFQERHLRVRWHQGSLAQPSRSSPRELHDLDVAIDALAGEPALVVTASAAGFSLLNLLVIFAVAGWLSTSIVVMLIALCIPIYVRVGRQSALVMEDFHRRRSVLLERQLAILRSITDLRALGAVAHGAEEIAAATNAENRSVIEGARITIRSTLVTEFLGGVSVGLVAMVVGIRLWHQNIALSNAFIAVLATAEMFSWLRRYGTEFHRRDNAQQARRRLQQPFNTCGPSATNVLLRFDNLETASRAAPVSLSVTRGQRIALRGASGVGKTSLIETFLGARIPIGGSVQRIDRPIGWVRAEVHFLRGTLRENLALDSSHDESAILDLVSEVGLDGDRFGDLDASLSDDARSLSTGERVKIALVRALLADVELLVIDDIAGLLDHQSRRRIGEMLERRTDLAIIEAAHDVSLLTICDETIIVEPR